MVEYKVDKPRESVPSANYKGKIGEKGRYLVNRTVGSGATCKVKLGFDTVT